MVPKTPDGKIGVVGSTSLPEKEVGSQKTWIFISLHRLQIRYFKILLILARPLPIGYFTFYYFSFFLIFNRMDAWSLMRGDAFIHFVSGSRRVNIRLGVLLLIPKSPQLQCNPDIRVLFGPEKYLISGFGLFCLGKYGNTSYNVFYVQNTSLFNSYRHTKTQTKIHFQSVFTNNSIKN